MITLLLNQEAHCFSGGRNDSLSFAPCPLARGFGGEETQIFLDTC
jgi:hypothetical protein